MSELLVLEVARQALQTALFVAAPLLGVSLVVGLSVSLFQVATSVQDVTLTFVPKIVAVGLALILGGTWMLRVLLGYTANILHSIPEFIR